MKKNVLKRTLLTAMFLIAMHVNTNAQYYDWVRTIGSTGQDMGLSTALDSAGNVYVTGYFEGTISLYPTTSGTMSFTSFGMEDIFVAKFTKTGTLIWAKQMGGKFNDRGTSVTVSNDQSVYVLTSIVDTVDMDPGAGVITMVAPNSLRDVAVCKFNAAGNLIWAKQVEGIGDDQGRTIKADKQGNIVFAGIFYATPDFDPSAGVFGLSSNGWNDFFACKWSSNGTFLWANATGGVDSDDAYALGIDSSSNVYVSGRFQRAADFDPGAGSFQMAPLGLLDAFLVKYNAGGAFVWAKQFGGNLVTLDSSAATGVSMVVEQNGNISLTGRFIKKVDFDPGAGQAFVTSSGKNDVFLSRLDTNGVFQWVKTFGGSTGDDMVSDMSMDKFGNFYFVGYFYGLVDFNPGTAVNNLSAVGSWDVFVCALTNSGNYIWAKRFGAGMFDTGTGIIVDKKGQDIYTTGGFQDTPDFDTELPVFLQGSAGVNDVFLHKISQYNVGIPENDELLMLTVFPNPANSNITITVDTKLIGSTFIICDALGRAVSSGKLTSENTVLSIESLSTGLYFFQLNSINSKHTFKLIKN